MLQRTMVRRIGNGMEVRSSVMLTQGESQHQLANSFGIIQIQMEEFLNPSESVKQRVPVNVQLRSCMILVPKVEQVGFQRMKKVGMVFLIPCLYFSKNRRNENGMRNVRTN